MNSLLYGNPDNEAALYPKRAERLPPRLKLTLTLSAILRAWDRGQIDEQVLNIWLSRHYSD